MSPTLLTTGLAALSLYAQPTPVTVTLLQYDASQEKPSEQTILRAINKRGLVVWQRISMNGKPSGLRVIYKNLMATFVDPATSSIATIRVLLSPRDERYTCMPNETVALLGFGQFLGYPVAHSAWSRPELPESYGHTTTIETWASSDFGCLPLKQVALEIDHTGKILCQDVTIAEDVVPGEPDPQLFAIPRSYTNRTKDLVKKSGGEGISHVDLDQVSLSQLDATVGLWGRMCPSWPAEGYSRYTDP